MRFHRPAPGTRTLLGAVGLLALSTTGLFFLSLPFGSREDDVSEAPAPLPRPSPSLAGPLRSRPWSLESLPGLSFDEALTLLGTEVESIGKAPAAARIANLTRIEQVSARLGEMHVENVRKIAKAASYYESHSAEARERFARFRATYEDRWQTLQGSLEDLRAGDAGAGDEIQGLLEESGALRPPVPIPAAEDLPRRRLPARGREPCLTGEEWQVPKKVGVAPRDGNDRDEELGFVDRLLGVRAAHAQAAGDDLAETPEVRFSAGSTPEIQKLLDDEGLRGSPARIASWVRSHIEFVPIWGALQSSVTCLENRKGTAMDIASLTIALLRASGIRARYQAGTVRLPIEEAKNWLGNFESAIAASSLLQSGGIPAVVQVDGSGQPVALRFEHVWVRAFVDYIPHQGTCHVEGDTWVDIDTSIKSYEYLDVSTFDSFVTPDTAEALVQEYFSSSSRDVDTGAISLPDFSPFTSLFDEIDAASAELLSQLEAAHGSLQAREVLGRGRIHKANLHALGSAPPFEVLARGWEQPSLAETEQFGIGMSLESAGREILSFQLIAADLGNSHYSLSFRPESDIDRRILAGQIPQDLVGKDPESVLVPGIRLIPELRRDGTITATGETIAMGTPLDLLIKYREPVLSTASIRKRIIAGETTAIGLNLVAVPARLFENLLEDLSRVVPWLEGATGGESFDPHHFSQAALSMVVHLWFGEMDILNTQIGSAMECPTYRYPSAGFCSDRWVSDTLFGLPLRVFPEGVTVDIPGDVTLLLSRTADTRRMASVNSIQGLFGSMLEAFVPMEIFNTSESQEFHSYWIGSVTAMLVAWKTGDSLVQVYQENAGRVLPKLNLAKTEVDEIREAVDRGFTVITSLNSIQSGPQCLSGYIILDPSSGNGIYRMSGGLCGGSPFNCAVNKVPGTSPLKALLSNSHLKLINVWGHAARDTVEKTLREGWMGGAIGVKTAVVALRELINGWLVLSYYADPDSPESPKVRAAFHAAIWLHAYHVFESAVQRSLCVRRDAAGNCVESEFPSLAMRFAFETHLRYLREDATLASAEIGVAVPCACFCAPECGTSNLFDAEAWCARGE